MTKLPRWTVEDSIAVTVDAVRAGHRMRVEPDERAACIRVLFEQGLDTKVVASRIMVTPSLVCSIAKENGIALPKERDDHWWREIAYASAGREYKRKQNREYRERKKREAAGQ